MKTTAILLAAGSGRRMRAGQNKLFLTLHGKTILEHTADVFQKSVLVNEILVVGKEEELWQIQQLLPQTTYSKIVAYLSGGAERQDSVRNGLQEVSKESDVVWIHDGARPFVTQELLYQLLQAVRPNCGAIPGVPSKDTVKQVTFDGMVERTLVRSTLWNIQTPQCFWRQQIQDCHAEALRQEYVGTDDASLVEWCGGHVRVVPAYYENIKITTPEDLIVAEAFWQNFQEKENVQQRK